MQEQQVVPALAALAHDHRLAVYRMLVQAGPDGLSAGVIAERLGIPNSSLTFHIQQLHHAGLVLQRRVSRQLFYSADYASMNSLMGFLTENCCGGGASCAPACDPASSRTLEDENNEASACLRRG